MSHLTQHVEVHVVVSYKCLVQNLISIQFTSDQFQRRTRAVHNKQCKRIEEANESVLRDHYAITYGIKRDSALNKLRYFNVVDGLAPDVMHDVLEGVLEYEVKLLLLHCIEVGYFNLKLLNERIRAFAFGQHESSNKPSEISATTLCAADNSLKQSGTFTMCIKICTRTVHVCICICIQP